MVNKTRPESNYLPGHWRQRNKSSSFLDPRHWAMRRKRLSLIMSKPGIERFFLIPMPLWYLISSVWSLLRGNMNVFHLDDCSASGGSFWDRPPGCACLFWIQSGRGLDCSTSLPRGGLDLLQQSPNRHKVGLWNSLVGGRRYVTLAKWVTEVGHWPPSSVGNLSVIKETHSLRCERRRAFAVRTAYRQLHLHKIHKSTDDLNWRTGSYTHVRDMNIELMSCQKNRRHICTRSYRSATGFVLVCSTAMSTRAGFVFTTSRR